MRHLPTPRCLCDCHKDGCNILHCMACCDVSGKFIDVNGKVDILRYKACWDQTYFDYKKVHYIYGCEFIVKNKYNVCSTMIKDKRK